MSWQQGVSYSKKVLNAVFPITLRLQFPNSDQKKRVIYILLNLFCTSDNSPVNSLPQWGVSGKPTGFDCYIRKIVPKMSNPMGLLDTLSLGQTIDWCIIYQY